MKTLDKLFDFIKKCPTAYHTVDTVRNILDANGFSPLKDGAPVSERGSYYVVRDSSVIAFRISERAHPKFMITASHSDSPTFRVKMSETLTGAYNRLDVEKYGGMIYYSWLDRPLSVAGRVILEAESGVREALVNLDTDLVSIPSLAIHLNRSVNESCQLNPARDLLPLLSTEGRALRSILADCLGVGEGEIISHDLFLYNREQGRVFGADGELVLAPRLDDLESVFASLEAFISAPNSESVQVLAVFDNEEVGSSTRKGAESTFLSDVLTRVAGFMGVSLASALTESMMLSIDNAHASHPNHPEMSDRENAPLLNRGPVIKYNANQRYATDGVSSALFKLITKRAGVRTQSYYNRADLPGGSTLGSIATTKVSVPTVDIGFPQLAMHSASETAGALDLEPMITAIHAFYSTSITHEGGEYKI